MGNNKNCCILHYIHSCSVKTIVLISVNSGIRYYFSYEKELVPLFKVDKETSISFVLVVPYLFTDSNNETVSPILAKLITVAVTVIFMCSYNKLCF